MALEIIRIDTAGMTPEQLYNAMDQKLANLVQQLNMKLLFFNDQDTNIIETRKTILTIEQAQSEFEQVITNNIAAIDGNIYKIHGELADYKKVVAGELTAVDGYIATLRGEFADYKVIVAEDFTASTGRIDKLSGDLAEYKVIVAGDISAANGRIDTISGDLADYKKVVAGSIEAITGNFEDLKTNALTAEKADLLYASIGSLDAVTGRVGILEGDFLSFKNGDFDSLSANVANIQTLIFGSATGTVISSDFSNTVVAHIGDAQIQSAMIKELAFHKIAGVDINTTNLKIHSEDGRSQWFDNTIQISDANRTRVQIGKDGTGDYSLSAWDTNGNLMFDARGIKAEAIKDSIIRNDMIATDANISGSKLDINSVFKEINGSTETIKSNRIFLDEKKQTLDVAFLAMSEQVTEQGSTLTSYGTQLTTVQGQISSKIWKQDITTAVDAAQTAMNTQYSNLEQSLNGFKISVGETYSTKTEASEVLEAANQAISASQANAEDLTSFIKSTNSGFEDLQGQIDGSIMTWFYDYIPTSSNIPAKDWTSDELKNNHLGDLFYDTITGYCYRWQVLNNAYSWQRITDVDVTKALSDAAKAKDTADSKRRVFVTTPTPPYEIGDLWTQGTEGELMRCKVTKSESQSYSAADWAKATKYTDDTTANQAIRGIETTNSKISEITTDVDNITARVSNTETNLTEVNGNITDLSNRVSAAELSITKDAIISAVSDTYATKNALATVDGKFANYSTTTQMNSAIEQKANSITSTVSSTYATKAENKVASDTANAAKSAVDNLEIGGRNLALASGEGWSTESYNVLQGKLSEPWVVSETYTISIKGTVNGGGIGLWRDAGNAVVKATLPYDANKGLYVYTFQCPAKHVNDTTEDLFSIYNYPSSSAVSASIEWIKIEKGNKATDWTPAPEDVDESIGLAQDDAADAKTAVENVESTIQQLADSISQLIVGKDGQSLMKQTENGWVFDMKDVLGDLDAAADMISDLNEGIGGLQNNVGTLTETVMPLAELNSYITISKDTAGKPFIELGKRDSDFKVRITNEDINFMEGQDIPAYINNQKLNIKKATVEEELQFGGFVWTERTNGNMGLLWKG